MELRPVFIAGLPGFCSSFPSDPLGVCLLVDLQQQQLQAQHLSHAAHGPPVQLPPHPSGLQPPGIPPVTGSGSGLLALGALGSQAHLPVKDEKNHHDLEHRGEARRPPNPHTWNTCIPLNTVGYVKNVVEIRGPLGEEPILSVHILSG